MRAHENLMLVLVAFGAGIGGSNAQVFILNPLHDSYVSSEYPTTSYGSDETLFVHAGSNTKRTFLQFDLEGIALDTIGAASISLRYGQGGAAGSSISLHHVSSDSWDESTLTWSSAPAYEMPALFTATTQLGRDEVEWILPTSLFSTDADGKLSLLLKLENEGLSDTATFFSKEYTGPFEPAAAQLTITPVPEPAHALIWALGLGVWFCFRRFRKG